MAMTYVPADIQGFTLYVSIAAITSCFHTRQIIARRKGHKQRHQNRDQVMLFLE